MDDEVAAEIVNVRGCLLVSMTILSRMSGMSSFAMFSCLSSGLRAFPLSGNGGSHLNGGAPTILEDNTELEDLAVASALASLNIPSKRDEQDRNDKLETFIHSGGDSNTPSLSASTSNAPYESSGSTVASTSSSNSAVESLSFPWGARESPTPVRSPFSESRISS